MKIFDHHPMVFASHEPERFVAKPKFRTDQTDDDQAREARTYIEALFAARPLRAMRKRPIRRKAYRSRLGHEMRRGVLYGLTAAERLASRGRANLAGLSVPDFADLSSATMVVKSVSHQLLLDRIIPHAPEVKLIFLVRHPCGNVHSNLQGQSRAAMSQQFLPPRADLARLYAFDHPAEGLSEADFTQLEILAYRWAVFNDRVWRALSGRENVRFLRYEDLCNDPIGQAKGLFDWTGLDWTESCERFLRASISSEADAAGYHDLTRNPQIAAHKWRDEMAVEDIATVLEICRKSAAFTLFDTPAPAPAG